MRRVVCAACLWIGCGKGVQLHPELDLQEHDAGHSEHDAGGPDSVHDAGASDAGAGDAGRIDAGEPTHDSGTADAGSKTYELELSINGDGKGQISGPVTCDGTLAPCSGAIASDSHVTLKAVPDEWSTFAGWGGVCAKATSDTCNLVMRGMAQVGARFDTKTVLSASVSGPGAIGGNISCSHDGSPCKQAFAPRQHIVLYAEHEDGAAFVGWTGDCTGSDAQCALTMDGAKQVSAVFVPYYTLSIVFPASDCAGSGSVTGPQGLSCVQDGATVSSDSRCVIKVLSGSDVTLEGKPSAGSIFGNWSAPCADPKKSQCTLHVTSDLTVGAKFCNAIF
jgi:hypothetical protein